MDIFLEKVYGTMSAIVKYWGPIFSPAIVTNCL